MDLGWSLPNVFFLFIENASRFLPDFTGVMFIFSIPGKSLLWVAVLGLVIFYLYALAAFALFRDVFDPRTQMFCGSLWQCTVTIIRYGLVGDYDEVSEHHIFVCLVKL